ncbi:MAG: hypothetical protein ABI767_00790 [Rhodanobacter sp.]
MKHLINATTLVLALACVGGVSAAQDKTRTTNMRNVTVNELPVQYETYVADLHMGYTLQVLVGHAHRHYVQAQRAAEKSEALRMRGTALQPIIAVAIDDSSGPGVARQIQLTNSAQETVAIVNVYCKRAVPSGGPHCKLAPLPMRTTTDNQRLASMQAGNLQLVEVDLHN